MNPFYFGTAERALFGAYHPPRVNGGSSEGAVLCYPIHGEYMRAHRAFRQLTALLTREGVHVLRFDYFGTGDSAGGGEEATLEQWRRDIGTAIEELKDTAGLSAITLIGLRMGATLADRAARDRADVRRLVLWDPVVSGEEYLTGLLRRPAGEGFSPGRPNASPDVIGAGGFPISRRLFEELLEVRLDREATDGNIPVDLVVSHENPGFARLAERFEDAGQPLTIEVVPSDASWGEGDEFGSALIPQGIVRHIVERIAGVEVSP